jgi:hypothetical protein
MHDANWVIFARSAIAGLADGARTLASSAYEHVLIDFDEAAPRWYGAIEQLALKEPAALVELAEQATERVEMDGLRIRGSRLHLKVAEAAGASVTTGANHEQRRPETQCRVYAEGHRAVFRFDA